MKILRLLPVLSFALYSIRIAQYIRKSKRDAVFNALPIRVSLLQRLFSYFRFLSSFIGYHSRDYSLFSSHMGIENKSPEIRNKS